jgi:hypothetical protein
MELKLNIESYASHLSCSKCGKYYSIDELQGFSICCVKPLVVDYSAINHEFKKEDLLGRVKLPSLIINALNDPILGEKCFPYEIAEKHKYLYLETPKYGSHLGFSLPGG